MSNSQPKKRNSLETKFSKNNMLVAVRCRPLNQREQSYSPIKTVTIHNREIITISGSKKEKESEYAFDFAFPEQTPQEDIYHFTTETLIEKVLNGFNATVFAYGATGSGKTYTMVGNDNEPGVMIRALNDLFTVLNEEKEKKFNVEISYIEVYNEQLKDLLNFNNSENNVEIRNDPQKGTIIQGASLKKVSNSDDAFKLLLLGNRKRSEGITIYNENSSRSHAILQVHVKSQDSVLHLSNQVIFGKFILVDLAGSEKISTISKANSESGSINKSLLALTNCINKLVSNNKSFIPWRDSKLTRILQDSLSGNCRIVMIATISPSLISLEETIYTLQYASRAKNIKVNLRKNVVIEEKFRIGKYDQIIQNLKQEINITKNELAEKEKLNMSANDISLKNQDNSVENEYEDFEKLQKEIIQNFEDEIKVKKTIIEKEKEIENIKNEISENEFKLANNPRINVGVIKQTINKQKNEVINKKKNLAIDYNNQSKLFIKRKTLQKKISTLIEKDKESLPAKKLLSVFKYYITYLENLNTEHRKYINICELNRQDKKIKILTDQLQFRDDFILNAGKEITKNRGTFTYQNPKFQTIDEIDLNPYKPKLLKVYSNLNNKLNIGDNQNNDISNKTKTLFHTPVINPNNKIIKRIQSPNGELRISQHRQYNNSNELRPLVQNKNSSMSYLGKFRRNKNVRFRNTNLSPNLVLSGTNTINNIVKSYYKGGYYANESRFNRLINDNYQNFRNNIRYDSRNINRINTLNNEINKKSTNQSFESENRFTHTSRLENEIQKKVKTILGRNIIGRYKSSPYLKTYNQ